MYNPIQSYKQVSIDGPTSRAAAADIAHTIVKGIDNYDGPTANNNEVPTGAKISSFTLMACFSNLVAVSLLTHFDVQFIRSGQSNVTPGAVGGNPQRNSIINTKMFFTGKEQNTNFSMRVKVPRIFQRVREGDLWKIIYNGSATYTSATQAIYKFYR